MSKSMNLSLRCILQPDWFVAVQENDQRIWFKYEENGKLLHHLMVRNGSDLTTDVASVTFNKEKKSAILRRVADGFTMTFQAPNHTFTRIHAPKKMVNSLDVNQSGLGASCDNEQRLVLWECDSGEVRRQFEGHAGEVYCCRFFPSGEVLLSGGADMQLKVWNVATAECAATLRPGTGAQGGGHRAAVLDAAFVERGRNIISAAKDGTLKLWDVGTQSCLATMDTQENCPVNSCSLMASSEVLQPPPEQPAEFEFFTDGKLALGGLETGSVKGFDVRGRREVLKVASVNGAAVNRVVGVVSAESMSQPSFAFCTHSGSLQCHDVRRVKDPLWTLSQKRSFGTSLCASSYGQHSLLFYGSGDGSCCLVDASGGEVLREFSGPDMDSVSALAVDKATRTLFTGARDGRIRRYELSVDL